MNLNQLDIIVSDVPQSVLTWSVFWIKSPIMLMTVLLSLRLAVTV